MNTVLLSMENSSSDLGCSADPSVFCMCRTQPVNMCQVAAFRSFNCPKCQLLCLPYDMVGHMLGSELSCSVVVMACLMLPPMIDPHTCHKSPWAAMPLTDLKESIVGVRSKACSRLSMPYRLTQRQQIAGHAFALPSLRAGQRTGRAARTKQAMI